MNAARAGQPAEVLRAFQAVMEQFLELQRAMLPACVGTGTYRRHAQPAPTPPVDRAVPVQRADDVAFGRYRVVVADRPLSGARASIAPGRVIVITDDGRGVAGHVRHRLEADGHVVATMSTIECAADAERAVADMVGRHGPIGALVHLMPLSAAAVDVSDADACWSRLCHDTRTLFLMAQATSAQLEDAARQGGAAVLAFTGLGGMLGYGHPDRLPPHAVAGHGGVLGFTKCLALEWPEVRVRAVDLDTAEPSAVLAGHVLDELWAQDGEPEAGYRRGRRVGLTMAAAPAAIDSQFDLPRDAVVLATGGARGITADVCLELADRYQPTFVLVGQSSLPPDTEAADTARLTTPAEIKRALIARMQAAGQRVGPAVIDRAYRQLEKDREIRRNLGALTAAGARLHYVQLDVRDSRAFAALIDDIYATYGRLDGVLHGAGVIEDKLVRDKSLESFERVLRTKAASAFVLSQRLRFESLRFLVFFSSVAGRFGNRGQADYAAANEVMSKLAIVLNERWPGRICSIAWAPWDKHGMVSPELKREFARRGVDLLSPAAGRQACWREIQQGGAADAEIVIGGTVPAGLVIDGSTQAVGDALPLLKQARRELSSPGEVRFERVLDPAVDHYLDDHRLDGRPVLPLAVAAELMAEAAQATRPDLTVAAVRGLQLLKGIVVDGGPVPMVIGVRGGVRDADGVTEADVDISTPGLVPPLRYRATVQLTERLPERVPFAAPAAG